MVTYRFSSSHSSVRTVLTEKGHRSDNPPSRGKLPMTEADTKLSLAAPKVSLPDHALALPALSLSGNVGRVAGLRSKIMDSGVIDALIEFIEGRRDLSSDQVAAGLALARKIVPDLANMPLPPSDEDNDGKDASSEIEIHIVDPKA